MYWQVSRCWYIAVPTEVVINRPCARHVTECHKIHALSHGLLHNFSSSTALTSQRTRPGTRHKNGFHNIHALPHNVFYRSFLHSRANQALLSNVRMFISCYAMFIMCSAVSSASACTSWSMSPVAMATILDMQLFPLPLLVVNREHSKW
jgi:hypothetical protein